MGGNEGEEACKVWSGGRMSWRNDPACKTSIIHSSLIIIKALSVPHSYTLRIKVHQGLLACLTGHHQDVLNEL